MRKKGIAGILILMMLLLCVPGTAMADVTNTCPDINASSYIIVDASTGEILFGKNYDQMCAPASITKIMTAILAIESGKLDNEVTVPNLPEFESGAVTIHLVQGERYKLRDLVQVMLTASANDAAYTVANAVGGNVDKFVTQMNNKAQALGMTASTFKNPHGLDEEGHMVTAKEMAILAVYAMQNDTFREMVQVQQVNWVGISYEKPLPTTNQLFSMMPECTGIKTGNSSMAKRTFVASAAKDGRELIGVILGQTDDALFTTMKKLLNYGFDHTKVTPITQKGNAQTTLRFGEKQTRVISGETYSLIQSTDNASILNYQTVLDDVQLPIKQNQHVGMLQIFADGNLIHEVPLVAEDSVSKPINWLFVLTTLVSLVYVASIISRIINGSKKNKRKRNNEKAQRESAKAAQTQKSKYDSYVNVDHPTQPQKKTLQSSRERNNNYNNR